MRRTGRPKKGDEIEITEEMVSAAAQVLSENEGWVFGRRSAAALAEKMLRCALEVRFERIAINGPSQG